MSDNLDVIFEKVYKELENRVSKANKKLADEILKEIKDKTPVDTGALRDGYGAEVIDNIIYLTSGEDYWKHVEFGTSNKVAQPHIRPVLKDKDLLEEVYVKELGKGGKVY